MKVDPRRMVGREMVLCVRSGGALQEMDFLVTNCEVTIDAPYSEYRLREVNPPSTTRLRIDGIVVEKERPLDKEFEYPIVREPVKHRRVPPVRLSVPEPHDLLALGPDFSERDGPPVTEQRDAVLDKLLGRG